MTWRGNKSKTQGDWRKNIYNRRTSQCKHPRAGICVWLACRRNTSVLKAQCIRQMIEQDVTKKKWGPNHVSLMTWPLTLKMEATVLWAEWHHMFSLFTRLFWLDCWQWKSWEAVRFWIYFDIWTNRTLRQMDVQWGESISSVRGNSKSLGLNFYSGVAQLAWIKLEARGLRHGDQEVRTCEVSDDCETSLRLPDKGDQPGI